MAAETTPDPSDPERSWVPEAEAEESRVEVEDFLGGPGIVSTPGMFKGWMEGAALGTAVGGVLGAIAGLIGYAADWTGGWGILVAAVIGMVAGAVVGFVLGGAFGTLRWDQGGRRAEDDDGGPIGPSGRLGTSH
jgi:hypothetical protein